MPVSQGRSVIENNHGKQGGSLISEISKEYCYSSLGGKPSLSKGTPRQYTSKKRSVALRNVNALSTYSNASVVVVQ